MSLFASTAEFYGAFRSDVPPAVAKLLAEAAPAAGADRVRRLLDIGTGTGFVLTAMEPYFDELIGVDPDPELLAVGSRLLSAQSAHQGVTLVQGTAEEFRSPPGWQPQLITVCRAFHWFDRPRFLARAKGALAPSGALAIFGDRSVWAADAAWKSAVLDVVREFLGEDRRAGAGTYRAPTRDYTDDLLEAGFSKLNRHAVPVQRTRTIESVVGYLHSTSFASLAVLGTNAEAFDDCIAERLASFVDADGLLVDNNEFDILIARR